MIDISGTATFALGTRRVKRVGYGAMQLAGPGVFGPPKDRQGALAVLREALASGVDHIDTSDYYGPHVTNQLIREALHPYPSNLVIVTKIGARRGTDGSWNPAFSAENLTSAVHDNLRNLKVDALDVVNLRMLFSPQQCDAEAGPRRAHHRRDCLRAEPLQSCPSRRRRADRGTRRRRHRLCTVLSARRLHAFAVDRALGCRHGARRNVNAGCACLVASACTQHLAYSRHFVAESSARKSVGGPPYAPERFCGGAGSDWTRRGRQVSISTLRALSV